MRRLDSTAYLFYFVWSTVYCSTTGTMRPEDPSTSHWSYGYVDSTSNFHPYTHDLSKTTQTTKIMPWFWLSNFPAEIIWYSPWNERHFHGFLMSDSIARTYLRPRRQEIDQGRREMAFFPGSFNNTVYIRYTVIPTDSVYFRNVMAVFSTGSINNPMHVRLAMNGTVVESRWLYSNTEYKIRHKPSHSFNLNGGNIDFLVGRNITNSTKIGWDDIIQLTVALEYAIIFY